MAQVEARVRRRETGAQAVKAPGVLVILVTRDGRRWLPQCLLSISKQTHPRIGVLAVDNGSSDGSADLLESALRPNRVVRLDRNAGFAGAVAEALHSEMARQADYLLLLHDDTILAPTAVGTLVETAEKMGAGVVGPKVLDWEDARILRGIGFTTDRFGYPYSPLEEGEVDHGQYDRVREVRFVSSCAMLVSREAWTRIGPPDERLGQGSEEDLDYCWRAQLAGFHVLMTPNAVVHHRGATERRERAGSPGRSYARYRNERVALASVLKNYSVLSLIWVLPLYFAQGAVRILLLALSRRFEDASQVLGAWGWNLVHLPSTLRLRVRAQAIRAVPDRSVRRSMAPTAIRLRQWAASASSSLIPSRLRQEAEHERGGLTAFAVAHPVALAWVVAIVVALIAYRNLLFARSLSGGGLGVLPRTPAGFFGEFVSALRSTGLGGSGGASPALALLGLGSVLTVGSPALLQKVLLLLLPLAGSVGCYRAVRSITHERISAVGSAGCYGLSGVLLWSFAQGRLPVLVLLAGLPWLAEKISLAFDDEPKLRAPRWIVGAGLGVAILASFYPGVAWSALLLAAGALVVAPGMRTRVRGLAWLFGAAVLAGGLVLPVTLGAVRAGAWGLAAVGTGSSLAAALRLGVGTGPGSWVTAFCFPAAAAVALVFVSRSLRRYALRAALVGLGGVYLAWASGAGHLPTGMSNAPAYLSVAAFEFALLIGLGLASLFPGVAAVSFGLRHLGASLMAILLAAGLGGQAVQALEGSWAVGPGGAPPAYAVVLQAGAAPFRVLWLGRPGGGPFPAPGGLPERIVAAGGASVRFSVTLRPGASALDVGRPAAGPGYDALGRALSAILAGRTQHGGALLAPFGVRFVVASPFDLPVQVARRLSEQLDLDLLPTTGLTILRNDKAVPLASEVSDSEWVRAASGGGLSAATELPAANAIPLAGTGERYSGVVRGATGTIVLLSQQFDAAWRLASGLQLPAIRPYRAFGWAVGFPAPAGGAFTVRHGGQEGKRAEVAALAVLWLAALWITRRPVRGR